MKANSPQSSRSEALCRFFAGLTEFTFTNATVNVRIVSHVAFGHETYRYRIALKDGRVIERDGVATSVLTHGHSAWKIAQYHSSSRAPRPN